MKKWIWCVLLSCLYLSTGCASLKSPASSQNIFSSSQEGNTSFAAEELQTDSYYIEKYVRDLDICMNVQDDFYFDSPEELSVEQLFLYFRYITSKEELYDYEQWYNKEQDLYIFPAEYMVTTLKQYMDVDCGEDLRKESYYNAETGNIEVQIFSGFGGHRDVSLRSKSKQGNLLTLIADFYNDESKENGSCYCSVRYTIEERADAFVYRKIEKAKVAGGTDFG